MYIKLLVIIKKGIDESELSPPATTPAPPFLWSWTYDFDKNDFGPEKPFDLSRKVLVVEGAFLFHPEHTVSNLWDKRIYLNADPSHADKKRIGREKKKWGKEYLPEDHQDNWTRYFKEAYKRYVKRHKPEKKADVTFKF